MNNSSDTPMLNPEDIVTGNHFDKYRSSNRIHRWMMSRFLSDASDLLKTAKPESVVEAGCGPGDLASELIEGYKQPLDYRGIDISPEDVATANAKLPDREFQVASIYELPYSDQCCDLVVACEVMEHLEDPVAALGELARVTRRWALVSVPWEPVWRILNFARGKYMSQLGNTPGHLQHFTRAGLRRLVRNRFEVVEERHPLPWTMMLLELK